MDLSQRVLPVIEGTSEGKLAIALHFKMLAALHSLGKLDETELATVASALIAEIEGTAQRFDAWTTLENLVPDFTRPENAES